jgi:hypothetical protein
MPFGEASYVSLTGARISTKRAYDIVYYCGGDYSWYYIQSELGARNESVSLTGAKRVIEERLLGSWQIACEATSPSQVIMVRAHENNFVDP